MVRTYAHQPSLVHYQNLVCLLDSRHALGDEALAAVGEFWRRPCLPDDVGDQPADGSAPTTTGEVR